MGLAPSRLTVALLALSSPPGGESLTVPRPSSAARTAPTSPAATVTLGTSRTRHRRRTVPGGTALRSSRDDYYGDDGDGGYGYGDGYPYGGDGDYYDGENGGEAYDSGPGYSQDSQGYSQPPPPRRGPPPGRYGYGSPSLGARREGRSSLPYNSRSDAFDAGGQAAYRADTFRRDSDWPQRDTSRGSGDRFGGGYGGGASGGVSGVGNPQVSPSRLVL